MTLQSRCRAVVVAFALALACGFVAGACIGRSFQSEPTRIAPIDPTVAGVPQPSTPQSIRVDCLDSNGDRTVTAADLTADSLIDLNLDGIRDQQDVGVLKDISVPLDSRCSEDYQFGISPAASGPPDCAKGQFVFVVGITGSADHGLKDTEQAGIVSLVAELRRELKSRGVAVASAIAAPNIQAATHKEAAMESWLEFVLLGVIEKYPCARFVLAGHSHGATSALAVSRWIEDRGLGDRIAHVALIDRVTFLYDGAKTAMPARVPVLHLYELNEGTSACPKDGDTTIPSGEPIGGSANVVDVDVSSRGLCHFDIVTDPAIHHAIVAVVAPP